MNNSVIVIGTILLDCKGFASTPYRPQGRNLGSVQFIHGGVGRNVTENLARIGIDVAMASTVNSDGNGRDVVEHLQECGARTEYIMQVPERGMGLWMAILDENGQLAGSISDMPDLAGLEKLMDEQGEEIISNATHIVLVLDLNEYLTKKTLDIAKRLKKPVYGLPSNFSVIHAHPEVLEGLECFVCNEFEGERILGCEQLASLDKDELLRLLREFAISRNLGRLVVTLGGEGSVYYDAVMGEGGYQPVEPVSLVDTSGAGDAFFSGTIASLLHGASLMDAVKAGTRIAGWTIEHKENCCRSLNELCRQDPFINAILERK
jgi:pseudouridine kinase